MSEAFQKCIVIDYVLIDCIIPKTPHFKSELYDSFVLVF